MSDKVKKIENILELLERENPSTEEIVEVVELILEKIEALRGEFSISLSQSDEKVSTRLESIVKTIDDNLKTVLKEVKTVDENNKAEFNKTIRGIYVAIREVESAIPKETDLDPLYKRIEEVVAKIPEVPKPVGGDETVEVINSANKKIDKERIEGLEEEIRQLKELINSKQVPSGARGMRKVPIIKRIDLTSQVDGVTRDFKLPKDTVDVLGLWGTQFPITFNSSDWTLAGNTLTIAAPITTPESGQTLTAIVEVLFYG